MTSKPLSEWTDDDIRSKLLALGESIVPITATTRPFLLKKIERLLQTANDVASAGSHGGTNVGSTSESSEADVGVVTNDLVQKENVPFEGYYTIVLDWKGAALERDGEQDEEKEHSCPLFTNRADALKAIKNKPGARFKKFESKDRAIAFWESQMQDNQEKIADTCTEDIDSSKSNVPSEKANSFPSLKTPALNAFRKLIEAGDVEKFSETVWANPRYLITSGDTPEILQQGCRYNALHCAVRSGKLDVCQELLRIIQDEHFWKLVYPDDSDVVRQTRRDHLLDLYLNMQDKVNRETPLHFACKYGHTEVVAFLVGFSCTCQTIKNKYGQIPADVVCKDGNRSAKSRIEQILKEPEIYYVPVLRSVDNSTPPQLFSPCTLPELTNQSPLFTGHTVSSPVREHALAGPMSPSRANEFYREWRSPSQSLERKEMSIVKRSDPERGMERVGRKLAHIRGVGWKEHWDFLGCLCDLSLPEGQQMVEEYLKELSNPPASLSQSLLEAREDSENPLLLSTPTSSSGTSVDRQHVFVGVSGQLFRSGDCEEVGALSPSADNNKDLETGVGDTVAVIDSLAELLEKNLSFNEDTDFHTCTNPTPTPPLSNKIFLAGSEPSKLDLDVLRALDGAEPDPSEFPHLHDWFRNIRSFSEQQQKCWRTPTSLRHRPLRSFKSAVDSSSQPISPLVFSSPSSAARKDSSLTGSNPPSSSHAAASTPKRKQQTQTPGRYFIDFRHSPHQQQRTVASLRSTGTTPQRNGSGNRTRSVNHLQAPL